MKENARRPSDAHSGLDELLGTLPRLVPSPRLAEPLCSASHSKLQATVTVNPRPSFQDAESRDLKPNSAKHR